jgi:predicted AAA+ superfamily ATPase
MIKRENYLNILIDFKDKSVIKVITGIRRCGKSTLMLQFIEFLKDSGVKQDRIIYINLESFQYDSIIHYKELYELISKQITKKDRYYIFVDEVQNVEQFERAINSLTIDYNIDIYLTGSNAYMLSSEISTLLSGRYVEINMLPLSFKEYVSQWENQDYETTFYMYMKYGGFPFLAQESNENIINNYLDGIYNTVVLKDVVKRNNIKDINLLENILKMVLSSVGSLISPNSISKMLKNEGKRVTNETVEKYIEMFCAAYILNKAVRFDIKGKAYLKTLNKYYVSDLGLRNNLLGYRQIEATHALENIIYFELLRRGFKVDIGKVNNNEIDFIARKNDKIEYYQVSYTVNESTETLQRELNPFYQITDHYQKYLITMDKDFISDFNGITKINAIEWLLKD